MQFKSVIPALFFFAIGLAASYAFAVLIGLVVFSSMQQDETVDGTAF